MQLTFKELIKEQVPPQVIVVAAFVVMLAIGYGIWSSETSGDFTVTAPLYATDIFVDNGKAATLKNPGDKMTFTYPAGKHIVIVSRGGYWPWKKDLNIVAKQNIALSPFLVEQEINPEKITQLSFSDNVITLSEEYSDALALFKNLSISDEMLPLVAATNLKDVRAADYFPGRKDVLLVAVKDGIFAIDAVQKDPRNFQPVYKGTSPVFVKTANDVLLVKDGDSIFRIAGIK
jgi:hypothetical protein